MKGKRRSTRGILLKEISKPLPSSILDNWLLKKEIKKLMKNSAGIYALYKQNKLYYVGLTEHLHGRIRHHHLKDRHSGKWDTFRIFMIKKDKYLKDIETLILNINKPRGNRQKGKIPRAHHFDNIIKRIIKVQEEGLKSFEQKERETLGFIKEDRKGLKELKKALV